MKKTFNLKSQRLKMVKAYYDGGQGVIKGMTRSWMNCYKIKCDAGMGPGKAWDSCRDEFQEALSKSDWRMKYS